MRMTPSNVAWVVAQEEGLFDNIDLDAATQRGVVVVNEGAAKALCERNASLLPVGVVRVEGGDGRKALAFSCDVNPRYCAADPFEDQRLLRIGNVLPLLRAVGNELDRLFDPLRLDIRLRRIVVDQASVLRGLDRRPQPGTVCRPL